MTNVTKLSDNLIYLTNSMGEETEKEDIFQGVFDWYLSMRPDVGVDALCYLVRKKSLGYGILWIVEITHPEAEGMDDDEEVMVSSFGEVQTAATNLVKSLPLTVMVGDETGFMARHELGVFIPRGTAISDYNTYVHLFNKNFVFLFVGLVRVGSDMIHWRSCQGRAAVHLNAGEAHP